MEGICFSLLLWTVLNGAFGYHCDFESGLCGWQNDVANAAGCGWTLRKGLAATLETGPFFDHTYETPNGSFLYFQSGYCRQITDRGLVSANLPLRGFSQGPICVKFWYLMYGTGNGYNLAVRTKHKTEDVGDLYLNRAGNRGRSWKFVQVSVNKTSELPLILSCAVSGNMSFADVAIDDIDISGGSCGAVVDLCDFELGDLCGFSVVKKQENDTWQNIDVLSVNNKLQTYFTDHTVSSLNGHVAWAYLLNTTQNTTSMVSPLQRAPDNEQCLNFHYTISNISAVTNLSVSILTDRQKKVITAWTVSGDTPTGWEYGSVPISLKESYKYMFTASKEGEVGIVLVDDVSVFDGPCPLPLTCTFTNGSLCGWTNADESSAAGIPLSWISAEPYPDTWYEGTIAAGSSEAEEDYLFLDSRYGGPKSGFMNEAALYSQRVLVERNTSWCFSFAYRILQKGSAAAALTVNLYSFPSGEINTLFWTNKPTAGEWIYILRDIDGVVENSSSFGVLVDGLVDGVERPSRIELDGFLLRKHRCPAQS